MRDDHRTEKERMLAGALYLASDPYLADERLRCRRLLRAFNDADPADEHGRFNTLERLFASVGPNAWVEPPFFCDYGWNISVGARFYANFGCVILDPGRVDIGDDVSFGPGVHLYTAEHPIDPGERVKGPELARPVVIGDRVWVGGGAIILPGVSIGAGSTIGAGSVVTRSVPDHVVAAGNPCRIIRDVPRGR